MSVRIFNTVNLQGKHGQIIHIDDSNAQILIDNKVFWVSREELERLFSSPLEKSQSEEK